MGSSPPSPAAPTCCSRPFSRPVRVKAPTHQGWVTGSEGSAAGECGASVDASSCNTVGGDMPPPVGTMGNLSAASIAEETPFSPPSPSPADLPCATHETPADPPSSSNIEPAEAQCESPTVTPPSPNSIEKTVLPLSPVNLTPGSLAPLKTGPRYGASVPVGGGKFVPVGSGLSAIPVAQKIDFESEKAKIEEEFTKLEEELDSGKKDRAEIEREFDALTRKADTLRRLQDAEAAAGRAQLVPRATQLAPVRIAIRPVARDPNIPSMAVVHWKKVTKEQYEIYKAALIEKYGSGADKIKTIQKIPNRILITAPIPAVMERILADVDLDPRPEPYEMPGSKK